MRRGSGNHPLMTEQRIFRLVGGPLLAVTVLSGLGCGLLAIAVWDAALYARSEAWLMVPGSIPLCFSLLRGRSLLTGLVAGLFAAMIAFRTVGLYGLWQIACFIITFMGDC